MKNYKKVLACLDRVHWFETDRVRENLWGNLLTEVFLENGC